MMKTTYGCWYFISITLQVTFISISHAVRRTETVCPSARTANSYSCAEKEMLLPLKLTLGNTSDSSCHNMISAGRLKGSTDTNRCCRQGRNDTIADYCIPGRKDLITSKYYLDFINNCTGVRSCSLISSGAMLQYPAGNDYMTFDYDCIDDSTVMRMTYDGIRSGKEVYLYNDNHEGDVSVNCFAYTVECSSVVIIEIVANNIKQTDPSSCTITNKDVYQKRSFTMNCQHLPPSHICLPNFRSQSNHVGMTVTMTVHPGTNDPEFLWIKVSSSINSNVTVACGSKVPQTVPKCQTMLFSSVETTVTPSTTPTTTSTSTKTSTSNFNHRSSTATILDLSTKHSVTACYTFKLSTASNAYQCSPNERLLPLKFALGVSSDNTCHNWIASAILGTKSEDDIKWCCKQRESDHITSYILPAQKNNILDSYYVNFINMCTGGKDCTLSTLGGKVQHGSGEDYVTFDYACVDDSIILQMNDDAAITGSEVYLYNDQNDGEAMVDCIAYTTECYRAVNVEIVASKVTSPTCTIQFDDGKIIITVDCKNMHATSWRNYRSSTNYMEMHIHMTVDPGQVNKEFLWIKASASTNTRVTVACGSKVPESVSSDCPSATIPTTGARTTEINHQSAGNAPQNLPVIILGSLFALVCLVIAVVTGCFIKMKLAFSKEKKRDEELYDEIQDTGPPQHTPEIPLSHIRGSHYTENQTYNDLKKDGYLKPKSDARGRNDSSKHSGGDYTYLSKIR